MPVVSNIAILIPTLKKGGAEKQAVLLAKALRDDYNVTLMVVNKESGFEPELVELSGLQPGQIICLDTHKKRQLFQTLRSRHIDTLFCYLTWPDFWGPLMARLAGVKTIYQGLRNTDLPKWKLLLERIGNRCSTGAIINNYAGVEVFKKKGIKRLTVIPNCYLNPMPNKPRTEREYITAVTVGRFVKQKDYPVAISAIAKAMARNPRLRFKIIGHGKLEDMVRKLIIAQGIDDRTEILINPSGILNHLLNADIYLSTSLFEGTSNSIMEALDASLPVVATDVGDNDQLVNDGETGFLVNTGDVSAITASLLKLASDRNLRNTMGEKGNRLLKEKYGFENFKAKYLELLENERYTECD